MMRKLMGLLVAIVAIAFAACEKEDVRPDSIQLINEDQLSEIGGTASAYEYRLNNRVVPAGTFSMEKDPYTYILIQRKEADGSIVLVINAFTHEVISDSTWEDSIPPKKPNNLEEFEEGMVRYALESNVMEEYKRTGKVPDHFKSYQKSYYYKIFGEKESDNLAGFAQRPLQDSVWAMTTTPAFSSTWNNEISACSQPKEKSVAIYADPFFQKRLFIIQGPTHTTQDFSGPLGFADDQASSVVVYPY